MPHQCRVAKIVISHLALPLRGSVGIALALFGTILIYMAKFPLFNTQPVERGDAS